MVRKHNKKNLNKLYVVLIVVVSILFVFAFVQSMQLNSIKTAGNKAVQSQGYDGDEYTSSSGSAQRSLPNVGESQPSMVGGC